MVIIRIECTKSYLARNVFHVCHSFVLVVDIICIGNILHSLVLVMDIICVGHITGYLACNVYHVFQIYSSTAGQGILFFL